MNESELTECLDRRDQLDTAHGAGVYALECDVPNATFNCCKAWKRHHDVVPKGGIFGRLAAAETVLYVGASSYMYDRLCDHVNADVRKAAFLEAFPPVGLHSIWGMDDADTAFSEEFNVASRFSSPNTRVWTDGELL